ncbi:MAG TPA: 4Fe-4S dicluster domain-containing protein [Anaerolineae bacterium]|nr:4Fe-4S dicluster domain-containing protein [Anaerolineae bacterium]
MVYVDVEKCVGCGSCVEACPIGAISLVGGTARVDQERCTECEACVEACPNGAMLAVREPVAERAAVPSLRPAPEAIEVRPWMAPVPLRTRLAPLVGSALAFVGRQVVPHLIRALNRRLGGVVAPATRGRGPRRRRRRGKGAR